MKIGRIVAALAVSAVGVSGCGGLIVVGRPAPPRAVVVVEAPTPAPPPATVVVETPAPAPSPPARQVVVVEGSSPPARVFVRVAGVPADYPDFVPVYTNSTVMMSARGGENGKRAYVLQTMTGDPPDAVVAFYKSQMGVPPTAEVNMGPSRMLVYADKFHRNKFTVTISANGPQTVVLLAAESDVR